MKLTDVNNQPPARPAARHRAPVICPWLGVVAAWTLALIAVLTNQSYLINHHYLLEESHLPVLVALVIFLVCWQVMVVGMMLPSSMPMMYIMVHASRKPGQPRTTQLAFLAGYTAIWTGFAAVAFLGDTLIHQLVHRWVWLYLHSWMIGAATLALAGGFQFSPLKEGCLKQCRRPFRFFRHCYRKGVGGAWWLGLRHGMVCLGSCWALMLVMFGLGMGSLVSMALLTEVMVMEKTFPVGQRLSRVIGVALLGLAVLWLLHPVWLTPRVILSWPTCFP
jgi:predicted metal-binding membrane protein